ncbi:hypothetical protein PH562_03510 [Rhizobium sp. CNPSo 4062]|uniref:hypothetical protein n=1 Tax=Rhizobium sp. CNPSo 4062 TaxID=3021410 RepID=UPI00254D1987|nr:hypothetical protein [Rhizobium sp. CNPSo 4062]MDK4701291.1 hypothetical protein [Rhizobium sp. CNPSo 4062]
MNAALCRLAYEDSVEALARLAAYSTSRPLKIFGYGEYYTISSELCKKDLIVLAISIRRLAELTKSQDILKAHEFVHRMPTSSSLSTDHKISCWKLIGNIIHSVEIEIIKDVGMLLYGYTDILKVMENKEEIDVAITLKSDKDPEKLLRLNDFIIEINKYLEEANDILSDNGIFLGSAYE